jgi:hypothetical protein
MTAVVEDRNTKAAEHLESLHSLANELEKAMRAIANNAVSDLEESVTNQQILCARLIKLAGELSLPVEDYPSASIGAIDEDLMHQIWAASGTLHQLNQRYAALLQHSSRSVALMTSLFSSFQGQIQEVSGPGSKHQTWSCQM